MVQVLLFADQTYCTIQSWSRGLGVYRIQTELRRAGYTCDVIDFISVLSANQIKDIIANRCDADTLMVGWASTFLRDTRATSDGRIEADDASQTRYSIDEQKAIYEVVKSHSPKAKVVAGAVDIFHPDRYYVDLLIIGHADSGISEIAKNIQIGGYSDVSPENPKLVRSDILWPVSDLSHLSVDWSDDHYIQSHEWIPIEISRGCIFNCKFCNHALRGKKKLDYWRDPDDIYQEIMNLYTRFGITRFILIDDTLNDTIQKLEMIKSVTDRLPFRPKFMSFIRIDLLARFPKMIELLDDIGFVSMHVGIESLHPEALKSIGKTITWERLKDTISHIRENYPHMRLYGSFIVGLPHEGVESVYKTADIIADGSVFHDWVWYPLGLSPVDRNHSLSEFNQNPEKHGYRLDPNRRGWWINDQMDFTMAQHIAAELNNRDLENRKIAGFRLPLFQSLYPDMDFGMDVSMKVMLSPEEYTNRSKRAEYLKRRYFENVVPEITYLGGYNK